MCYKQVPLPSVIQEDSSGKTPNLLNFQLLWFMISLKNETKGALFFTAKIL